MRMRKGQLDHEFQVTLETFGWGDLAHGPGRCRAPVNALDVDCVTVGRLFSIQPPFHRHQRAHGGQDLDSNYQTSEKQVQRILDTNSIRLGYVFTDVLHT